jgi:hypothetical protein
MHLSTIAIVLSVATIQLAGIQIATAQQPEPTAPWKVKYEAGYKQLAAGTQAKFKEIDNGKYQLVVNGGTTHELSDVRFDRLAHCRVSVENGQMLNSKDKLLGLFIESLDTSKCGESTAGDWYFTEDAVVSGHDHEGNPVPPHDHRLAFFRVCVRDNSGSCVRTHMVLLFFLDDGVWPPRSAAVTEIQQHNGLIHGPQ